MELPVDPIEGPVGWAMQGRERGVTARVDGPLGRPLERFSQEFDQVGVLLVDADTVRRVLDAVTE